MKFQFLSTNKKRVQTIAAAVSLLPLIAIVLMETVNELLFDFFIVICFFGWVWILTSEVLCQDMHRESISVHVWGLIIALGSAGFVLVLLWII